MPEQAEQDAAPAADAGGGKAVKLGCSKCRMSRKGCSVCRVKAGLAPLATTHLSPRKCVLQTTCVKALVKVVMSVDPSLCFPALSRPLASRQ